jgi:hypothetical protein
VGEAPIGLRIHGLRNIKMHLMLVAEREDA